MTDYEGKLMENLMICGISPNILWSTL